MNYYPWLVYFHVLTASVYFMNLIFMQLIFDNAMKKISNGPEKKEAGAFVQKNWLPIQDVLIVILGATGLLLFFINYKMIFGSGLLIAKVAAGTVSLCCAYANHFVFRAIKRRLSAKSGTAEKLQKIQKISRLSGRTALWTGTFTVLIGWYVNYFGI